MSVPLSQGVKQPRREPKHSPPSSTEVQNKCRYTTTPAHVYDGVHMTVFTGSSREKPKSNIKNRKAKWTGQTLRRNCLLRWVIEGNIER